MKPEVDSSEVALLKNLGRAAGRPQDYSFIFDSIITRPASMLSGRVPVVWLPSSKGSPEGKMFSKIYGDPKEVRQVDFKEESWK